MFSCLYVLIMYVNSVCISCILLSLFYLYCVHIALFYSNVHLSHNKKNYLFMILKIRAYTHSLKAVLNMCIVVCAKSKTVYVDFM